jgi:hypothetical protein
MMKKTLIARSARSAMLFGLAALGCGDNTKMLTRAELMDPTACMSCHPQEYNDWSRSMHAYAGQDPLFLAMNQRGQRETQGALGNFCVKCHAPVAVAQNLTPDGLNLATLDPSVKGVTCFFCHSADAVDGTHNNPLTMSTSGGLFGPFDDPAPGAPHRSSYSALFDLASPQSAQACGGCHDIVNQHGAAVERTYMEWQATIFSNLTAGQTCVRCHMDQTEGPASTISTGKIRALGGHALPGVDLALTAGFPGTDTAQLEVQALLDSTIQGTLCLTDDAANPTVEVTLDNVGAGHFYPSGATPDRRAWVAITAYAADQVIYQSGAVPAGQSVEMTAASDPDLWLIRDCLFDGTGAQTNMFWDAATLSPSNQIPGSVKQTVSDPTSFTRSHVKYVYPTAPAATLPSRPDRITLSVILKPVGDEVLNDLVATQDLDAAVAQAVPQFTLGGGAAMEWTAAAAVAPTNIQTNQPVTGITCVGTETKQYRVIPSVAVSRATCQP